MKQPEVEILVTCFVNFVFEIFHEIRRHVSRKMCKWNCHICKDFFLTYVFFFSEGGEEGNVDLQVEIINFYRAGPPCHCPRQRVADAEQKYRCRMH